MSDSDPSWVTNNRRIQAAATYFEHIVEITSPSLRNCRNFWASLAARDLDEANRFSWGKSVLNTLSTSNSTGRWTVLWRCLLYYWHYFHTPIFCIQRRTLAGLPRNVDRTAATGAGKGWFITWNASEPLWTDLTSQRNHYPEPPQDIVFSDSLYFLLDPLKTSHLSLLDFLSSAFKTKPRQRS